MDEENRNGRGRDPVLLAEAALALLLFALFVYLFLLPAGRASFSPSWWTWIPLGLVFFGLVGLDAWRRRRRRGRESYSRDPGAPPSPHRPDERVPPAT